MVRRALVALPEDASSVPNIHVVAHDLCNSGSRELCTFFWPVWALGMYRVHIHIYRRCSYTFGKKTTVVCPSGKLLPVA